jgi:hypothetical protein
MLTWCVVRRAVWVLEEQTRAERSTDEVEDVTSVRMNGFEGTRESSAGRS